MDADLAARIDKLELLAQQVNSPDHVPNRKLDVEIALTARPDIYFNAGPYYPGGADRIGRHDPDGDTFPGNGPDMLVPRFTDSWDATKKLMLPDWCIDEFNEWFDRGCGIKLVEGRLFAPTNRWFHTAEQHTISQQGPRDVGVLLAAILLSYAACLKAGTLSFEPRMREPVKPPEREPPAETHGDMC